MSKPKKKHEQLDNDTVTFKVIRGQGSDVYLYANDVMLSGPGVLQSNLMSDVVLCSFNVKLTPHLKRLF